MASELPQPISVNYDHPMSRPKIPETSEQLYERRAFAVAVRMFRGAVGWSQQDLADQLGLSKASIAKLELGIMRLAPENKTALQKLIKQTGVRCTISPDGLAVTADGKLIERLNPEKALSLPRRPVISP